MKYTVLIECDEETLSEGGYLAHIPAMPGCVGRGPTKDEAAARCEQALHEYLALLLGAGATGVPGSAEPLEWEVRETMSHTFDSDYSTLMPNETEQLVQWLEVNRDELLETVGQLSPGALAWKPAPDAWAIRNILWHMAGSDVWYVQQIKEVPSEWPEDLFERLAATRSLLIDTLRNLTNEERTRVTSSHGEEWTARKVARLALEHEREHLQQIRELVQQHEDPSESSL